MSKGTGHASGERRCHQHSEMSWAQTRTRGRKAKGAGPPPGGGPWGRVGGRGRTLPRGLQAQWAADGASPAWPASCAKPASTAASTRICSQAHASLWGALRHRTEALDPSPQGAGGRRRPPLGSARGCPSHLPAWLPQRLSFAFFLAGRNPRGNPLSCPTTRVSHPFSSPPGSRCHPSELAGGGGLAASQSAAPPCRGSLYPLSTRGPVVRISLSLSHTHARTHTHTAIAHYNVILTRTVSVAL